MEKFAGLPDIDYASKNVFETSDIESEQEPDPVVDTTADVSFEDLEIVETPFLPLKNRFTNETLVGRRNDADFLGSITNPVVGTRGYNVTRVTETTEQRLARISRELEELAIEKHEEDTKEITRLVDIAEDLKGKKSKEIDHYTERIQAIFSKESVDTKDVQEQPQSRTDLIDTSQVLGLEQRIHKIEAALGPSTSETSVANELRDLRRKINIIHNPEFPLTEVKDEISRLNSEMERINARKRFLEVAEDPTETVDDKDDRIEALYGKLASFEETNAIVPLLVQRLKSLHTVHSDMANCTTTVAELDNVLKGLDDDITKWDTAVTQMNDNLSKYVENFESNKKHIDERIRKLENKAKE